jgi:hypothetical protein
MRQGFARTAPLVLGRRDLKRKAGVAFLTGCLAFLLGAGPASAQGLLDANCPGPPSSGVSPSANQRLAQSFTAQTTGGLVRGEIEIFKVEFPGGDWVMQILATDGSGAPVNTVLASTTPIADATVPVGNSRLAGVFAAPASVVAGQQYALVLTRAADFRVLLRDGNPCPGEIFVSASASGTWFSGLLSGFDFVFAVFVKPSNAFTLGDLKRNKRKGTATLTVTVPYPGELTGSGQGVKVAGAAVISKTVPAAGPVNLKVRAKGRKKQKLNETGKVKVKPKITYTPRGGDPATQSIKVKLKKNL